MKIEMSGDGLADALGLVGSAVPSRASRPILSNILIRADHGKAAEIVATNMEVGIRVRLDGAKTRGVGAVLISHKRLSSIATEMRGEKLTLETPDASKRKDDAHSMQIKAKGTSFKLVGEDPADFPAVPDMPTKGIIQIVPALFDRLIRHTAFAAADAETRYAIHGVMMEIEGTTLRCIATDGKRLALNEAADAVVAGKHNATTTLLSSTGLSVTLRKAAAMIDVEDKIGMVVEDRRTIFQCGPITIVMAKIEGTFPSWEEVMPKDPTTRIQVDREELLRGIRRGALMAMEGSQAVSMKFDEDITIGARASNVGEGTIQVPIATKAIEGHPGGEALEVHFNPKYIEQFLKADDGQLVEMNMIDHKSAVLFVGADGFQYVVMPVTLESSDK